MENKNNVLMFSLMFLVTGLFIGGLLFGNLGRGSGMCKEMKSDCAMMTHDSMSHSMSMMVSNLTGKSEDQFDKAFLEEMIVHHEGAVQMAELALENAKRQEIKNMSSDIIRAQKKEIDQMKEWLQAWYK